MHYFYYYPKIRIIYSNYIIATKSQLDETIMIHNLHCNMKLDWCSQCPCIKPCTLNIHTDLLTLTRRRFFVSECGSTASTIIAEGTYVKISRHSALLLLYKQRKLLFFLK